MVTRAAIQKFLSQKTLAVIGASRSKQKFSYRMYKELIAKGYQVFPVNPNTNKIDGEPCFDSIKSLPKPVDGVVIVVSPDQTDKIINEVMDAGIRHVWIQQGAETQAAIDFFEKKGINVIHHQCILMFAEPAAFPHNAHRCIWGILGKIPK